jgi:hypothetical protein
VGILLALLAYGIQTAARLHLLARGQQGRQQQQRQKAKGGAPVAAIRLLGFLTLHGFSSLAEEVATDGEHYPTCRCAGLLQAASTAAGLQLLLAAYGLQSAARLRVLAGGKRRHQQQRQ